jgi:ATP-dependent helicase/nuclease subunit A
MTVHGVKGLEAPIVILPDTALRQEGRNAPQVVRLAGGQPVWRMKTDEAPAVVIDAEQARRALVREENRRLLYVALTRAQTWLIVCGAGAEGNGESWYGLAREAMSGLAADTEPGPDGDALVLSHNWPAPSAAPVPEPASVPALPDWVRAPALRPVAAAGTMAPSALGGELILGAEAAGGDPEAAKAWGTAVHRLLEHLQGVPAADRPGLAARLLPGEPRLAELLAEAEAVLDAPGLAAVFGPGSLAEVEVAAPLAELGGARILGRIDRLVVEPHRVLVVDFKSNQAVPAAPEAVPEGILRQLGAYRAALRQVWTDREVETAVLWTRTARLMPLPAALVDAALARWRP